MPIVMISTDTVLVLLLRVSCIRLWRCQECFIIDRKALMPPTESKTVLCMQQALVQLLAWGAHL